METQVANGAHVQNTLISALNGRIIRADIDTFVFATRVPQQSIPAFGSLVKTHNTRTGITTIGTIYNIAMSDNSSIRSIALADASAIRKEDKERYVQQVVVIEVSVLCLGYLEPAPPGAPEKRKVRFVLPSQPPWTLEDVWSCTDDETHLFTSDPRFLTRMLRSDAVSRLRDDLIVAAIRAAMRVHGDAGAFVRQCAEELARQMADREIQLDHLLRQLVELL